MTDSNRNRHGQKDSDKENRTGNNDEKKYQKLPDNPQNKSDESISTADDTANGKYSRTKVRDEDVNNEDTRGGR